MQFNELDISDHIIDMMKDDGITEPTEVQQKSIPPIFEGKDVLVESETGSGKTLSFSLPLIEQIDGDRTQALILCPTRELAKQVAKEIKKYSGEDIETVTIYGGVGYEPQIEGAKTANIVVGTPGRVLDLLKNDQLQVGDIEYFILDEADRMLDMGFQDELEAIIDFCPTDRQNLLFGATIPRGLKELCEKYDIDPETIRIERTRHTSNLEQYYIDVKPNRKISMLYTLLTENNTDLSLVFCRTKRSTRFVAKALRENGINAQALNGDMSQHQREKMVEKFKNHEVNVIVATDVAARGIHVDDITHVFNYDVPDTPDTYTHRIGRTARQGSDGEAITLLEKDQHGRFRKIHKENRDLQRMDRDEIDLKDATIP